MAHPLNIPRITLDDYNQMQNLLNAPRWEYPDQARAALHRKAILDKLYEPVNKKLIDSFYEQQEVKK